MIPEERNEGLQGNNESTSANANQNNSPYGTVIPDNVDEKIKNEEGTERLRSEAQSVQDGEKNNS